MELMQIYSVPMWKSEYPTFEEHKNTFLDTIRLYKEQNPSIIRNNVYGYRSPNTLHHISELYPLYEYICQMAYKAILDLDFFECDVALTESWLNINDNRQCVNRINETGEIFSGVFYLKSPEGSGNLVIKNPSINCMWKGCSLTAEKNSFTAENICIEPVEGNIVIFPSYLSRFVEPNNHDEERISISFNLIALPKGSIKNNE